MTGIDLPKITLDARLDPWDRQPDETTHRFKQFRLYLDPGRARTLRKVAETLACHPRYIRAVSSAYRWVERAEAYDRYRDQLDEGVWIEERRKAAERDSKILDAAMGKVAERLRELAGAALEVPEMIRLLDVTMRHRRALYGDPTDVIAVTGPGGQQLGSGDAAGLAGMSSDQRRAAIMALVEDVTRRTQATTAVDDE